MSNTRKNKLRMSEALSGNKKACGQELYLICLDPVLNSGKVFATYDLISHFINTVIICFHNDNNCWLDLNFQSNKEYTLQNFCKW